jgi:hypothetical protein
MARRTCFWISGQNISDSEVADDVFKLQIEARIRPYFGGASTAGEGY